MTDFLCDNFNLFIRLKMPNQVQSPSQLALEVQVFYHHVRNNRWLSEKRDMYWWTQECWLFRVDELKSYRDKNQYKKLTKQRN